MPTHDDANERTPSTTWGYRKVKIGRPAGGQQPSVAKPRRWYRLPSRDPRKPLTLTIKFRGGAECWYEVHARGSSGRFPGHVALHDVMREIHRQR